MAHTRTLAPANGTPRELKTMSSLRVPCACVGATAPGHTCSASISHAQKIPIAFFDRIIAVLFVSVAVVGSKVAQALLPVRGLKRGTICPFDEGYCLPISTLRRQNACAAVTAR